MNSLEGENAQWPVGFVACVVWHRLAPEIVAEDLSEAGAWSYVGVIDYSPNVVVHQLTMDRVAVAQGAEAGQHDVSTRSVHPLQPSTYQLGLVASSLDYLRCHVWPDFPNIPLGQRMQQSSDSIAVARLWLRLSCVTERTPRCCYAAFTYSWISGLPPVGFMLWHGCCCKVYTNWNFIGTVLSFVFVFISTCNYMYLFVICN